MNSTADIAAIATTELYSHLEQQVQKIAPERLFIVGGNRGVTTASSIRVRTPQRRANYSNKARLRRKDLKELAFKTCGWKSTANIKKYLKVLGINLDLRLTSAWDALVYEIKHAVDAAKALVDALMPSAPVIPTNEELLGRAIACGALADWIEHEEGGLYWIWKTPEHERELITSTGLAMYLRQLGVGNSSITH